MIISLKTHRCCISYLVNNFNGRLCFLQSKSTACQYFLIAFGMQISESFTEFNFVLSITMERYVRFPFSLHDLEDPCNQGSETILPGLFQVREILKLYLGSANEQHYFVPFQISRLAYQKNECQYWWQYRRIYGYLPSRK